MVERNIGNAEIRQAGAGMVVIGDYPDDEYGPSCLLLGFTSEGRPLHIQVSRHPSRMLKIITLYEPDPAEWLDYTQRRR